MKNLFTNPPPEGEKSASEADRIEPGIYSHPKVGDILDYGDGYRLQVAAVTTERVTKTDFKPNQWNRHQYRDYQTDEIKVWVWGEEPVQAIASGGGTLHVLPVEEHLTLFDNPYQPDKGGDTYPPKDAKVIRPGSIPVTPTVRAPEVHEDLDWHLDPDELKP